MTVTSDRHAAQLVFQTVNKPSADSVRLANQVGQAAGPRRSFIIVLAVSWIQRGRSRLYQQFVDCTRGAAIGRTRLGGH